MQKLLMIYLIVLLSLWGNVYSYKILIYSPRIDTENVNYLGRIADELVKAGHDVVIYLPVADPNVKVNGSKLAKLIQDKSYSSLLSTTPIPIEYNTFHNVWSTKAYSFWEIFKQLQDDELLKRLKSENFDFAITELVNFCGFALFNKLGIDKYASVSMTDMMEVIVDTLGVSSSPSFVPATISYDMPDEMNFFERLINFKSYMQIFSLQRFLLYPKIRQGLREYLPDEFHLPEAIRRCSLALINSDEFIQFPRLNGQKIVFIGGIALDKPEPLKEEYQILMDRAKNGIVLISFGTISNINQILPNINDNLISVFKRFPEITFLLNYDIDNDLIANIPNVIKINWIPQKDLLVHANLQALITCCDSNTIMEAAYSGVPLICIPFSAEQVRGSRVAQRAQIAITIEKLAITDENLANALDNIINSKMYKMRANKMAGMIRDKPISARECLIGQIEYAIKFGPLDVFDFAYNDLYFYQYYLLDIIIPILLLLILICYCSCRVIFSIFRKLLLKSKMKLE
ncbi:unnamed protein product [Cercopithifilaria johnstoni]|uniref:glucuronosyltransferase n=1 Tax=Cercopithifilaria johnstoni TaxID=2874296 RepID=A0A8J2LVM0_9BILA|nr:unnamed protein product [Cercopithifilaria johnstoni]